MLRDYEIIKKDPLLVILRVCICAVALFLIGYYMPQTLSQIEQLRPGYDETMVRVIANSNTAKDQQTKQQIVKDLQVIQYINIENPQHIQQIGHLLQEKYAHIPIELKIGDNLIPPKWMAQTFYPQMRKKSLVIIIGQGRGENWFCTVFPKVCGKEEREKIRFSWWEKLKEKWS